MGDDYYHGHAAFPKPEPRKKAKARTHRTRADYVAEIRAYVFGRERGTCRCCRLRPAESMHELRPRSLGGRISKANSVAVCGSGTSGCHGLLQSHRVIYSAMNAYRGADGQLEFKAADSAAADWLRVELGQWVASVPGSQRPEVEA